MEIVKEYEEHAIVATPMFRVTAVNIRNAETKSIGRFNNRQDADAVARMVTEHVRHCFGIVESYTDYEPVRTKERN